MPLRTDLPDFAISEENSSAFMEGEEIAESLPVGWTLRAHQDMFHCNCSGKSQYVLVQKVENGLVYLKKSESL